MRLVYGVKKALSPFQRMMIRALCGLRPSQAFLYMGDLVVISCSGQHMFKYLREVFQLCRQDNLKVHPEKYSFFMHEVIGLDHKCTDKGIFPVHSIYDVIEKCPIPIDANSGRRIVAFCNYYRHIAKKFSEQSRRLTNL